MEAEGSMAAIMRTASTVSNTDQRALPDPSVCRAKHAGFGDFADCLVEHPTSCRYSLSFGDGHLCRHPQREEIVRRTLARRESQHGA